MKQNNIVTYIAYFGIGLLATLVGVLAAVPFTTKSSSQDQSQPPTAAQVSQPPKPVLDEAAIQQITQDPGLLLKSLRTYDYDPKNKRDPFQPYFGIADMPTGSAIGPVMYLQRFDLDQLQLMGIIWDVARPRAMIKDPNGVVHLVEANSKIGRNNGYIAVVREGEIVVVEPIEDEGKTSYTTRVISIGR